MWLYLLLGLLLLLVALYPLQGWIAYLVQQRRREQGFTVTQPRHRPTPGHWSNDQITVAWLGHATLLINFHGVNILTDPVFGASVGVHLPFGVSFGPRRMVRCALSPAELPRLDLILQSHAHLDHLDTRSWRQLRPESAVVMATGNARYIRHLGFPVVTELDWGQSTTVAGVKVTAVPVKHWGERFPWSRRHGYNAYLIERAGAAILFGGDTAHTNSFAEACAGRRVQLAILPIGGYQPYIRSHASPEQTWQMFRDLGADYLVPIHHSTFVLSHEPPGEPLERLLTVAGADVARVAIRQVGETFVVPA
ncbi:MAG: hypothetical protein PCFJNLEI_00469 [Verrucomicrobiae bacterium]|nr:hypothetical protein [Verrucomicrobiae bacterium]